MQTAVLYEPLRIDQHKMKFNHFWRVIIKVKLCCAQSSFASSLAYGSYHSQLVRLRYFQTFTVFALFPKCSMFWHVKIDNFSCFNHLPNKVLILNRQKL